jgi:molybdenum cofactor synthesis domain-containing protein
MEKIKAAIITVSDKAFKGEREDRGGPALKEYVKGKGALVVFETIVPDEEELIISALKEAIFLGAELILTTGGTGFSPRDVTPEATLKVIERLVPGIPEYIRLKSSEITSNAVLSRAVCGLVGKSIILNLPGSPKGAVESLDFVWEPLLHGLQVLKGEFTEHA